MEGISYTEDDNTTIDDNIQNPTMYYRSSSTTGLGPCNTQYYNMWDSQLTSTDVTATATVKTVYDPCPPGFCVPTAGLYNFIKDQDVSTWNTGYTYNGVYFPASGYRKADNEYSGNLYDVGGSGYCWSATPYDGTHGRDFGFSFSPSRWALDGDNRAQGCPVRAVAE